MPNVEALVDDLYALAQHTGGPLDAAALDRAPNLLALPRYSEMSTESERRAALLLDILESVEELPPDHREHARLLMLYTAPGTNITHRREVFNKQKQIPWDVTKWRERYTLAQVASELIARAGRSPWLDRGPGYVHERIAYTASVNPTAPGEQEWRVSYDLRIMRDATYLFLVVNDDTTDGDFDADPWSVVPGSQQVDVGTVPYDPTGNSSATLSVVYLGRAHSAGEPATVMMQQHRTYRTLPYELQCNSDTPRRSIAVDLSVECPRDLAPTYARVIHASGAKTAPEISRTRIVREDESPMTFSIAATAALHSYSICWSLERSSRVLH